MPVRAYHVAQPPSAGDEEEASASAEAANNSPPRAGVPHETSPQTGRPCAALYATARSRYNQAMEGPAAAKIDKTAFSTGSLLAPSDEKAYWLSKTPEERLQAVELMRQIVYGYDPSTTRLQRVFETAQRPH